jgi:RNA polymerase sigma-70 factor (ECF subfamily)
VLGFSVIEKDNMDERELISRFKQGDRSAFRQLVERYQDPVINIGYRFLRNKEEAEEAAQEVFLKVFLSTYSYQHNTKFSTWLYRITVNYCINKLREKRKLPSSHLDKDLPAPVESQPDRLLEQENLNRSVREAIDSLPEQQRAAILLNQYGEFSYQEMAQMLDCSISAVESRLFRAKENLRKILTPYKRKDKI